MALQGTFNVKFCVKENTSRGPLVWVFLLVLIQVDCWLVKSKIIPLTGRLSLPELSIWELCWAAGAQPTEVSVHFTLFTRLHACLSDKLIIPPHLLTLD